MEYKDYYKLMGVERSASQDEIKRAYRKLARKFHPDVSQEANAEEKFKAVGEAYEVLKDPKKRKQYDQFGQDWEQAPRAGDQAGASPQYHNSGQAQYSQADFADFFKDMFGQHQQRQQGFQSDIHQGQDIHTRLDISLEDSFHGVDKMIQMQLPTINQQGQVSTETKTVKVVIPKGITDGQQIRLKGQGHQSANGRHGDLYIEIHLKPHGMYHVDGKNIMLDLPITPWEAALGGKISVPTLGGKVSMQCPENTQNGQQMRLKGRGLPGKKNGDQIVRFHIEMPKTTNDAAKKYYEQLRDAHPYNPRAGME